MRGKIAAAIGVAMLAAGGIASGATPTATWITLGTVGSAAAR